MARARDVGVNSIVLFPKVPDALKVHIDPLVFLHLLDPSDGLIMMKLFVLLQSPTGDEAYNENGLVPRTIRLLKDKYPDLVSYLLP